MDRYINKEVYKGKNLEDNSYNFKNIRIGADYFATDKATVGLVLMYWGRDGIGDGFNKTLVYNQSETELLILLSLKIIQTAKEAGSMAALTINMSLTENPAGHSM